MHPTSKMVPNDPCLLVPHYQEIFLPLSNSLPIEYINVEQIPVFWLGGENCDFHRACRLYLRPSWIDVLMEWAGLQGSEGSLGPTAWDPVHQMWRKQILPSPVYFQMQPQPRPTHLQLCERLWGRGRTLVIPKFLIHRYCDIMYATMIGGNLLLQK